MRYCNSSSQTRYWSIFLHTCLEHCRALNSNCFVKQVMFSLCIVSENQTLHYLFWTMTHRRIKSLRQ